MLWKLEIGNWCIQCVKRELKFRKVDLKYAELETRTIEWNYLVLGCMHENIMKFGFLGILFLMYAMVYGLRRIMLACKVNVMLLSISCHLNCRCGNVMTMDMVIVVGGGVSCEPLVFWLSRIHFRQTKGLVCSEV